MKTVKQPNEKVIAIIKTDRPKSEGLRLSGWTVPYSRDGINLMKNNFSGEVVQLTDEEFADPLKVPELAKRRFVVPEDYDEPEEYLKNLKLIRLMQPVTKGLGTYTILPTTACNARCTYCYEEGYAVATMSRETTDRLVDFICETKHEGEITLSWFGGEPLVCADKISYICKALAERGVKFRSRMITNASLVTRELVREAKELWNLGRVQVSLDGFRTDYTERKRYIDPAKHNYDKVMESIAFLAEEDIKVVLRVNFDRESIDRLRPFLDEMKERFGDNEKITLYLSPLYQEKEKPYFIELSQQMLELDRYIDSLKINNTEREKRTTSFRLNSCMADNLGKSIVIDPEGRFFDCEHLPKSRSWGNIFDGVTDQELFDRLCAEPPLDERCRSCTFLPLCTPFYKNGCPGWFDRCDSYLRLKTEYELQKLASKLKADEEQ